MILSRFCTGNRAALAVATLGLLVGGGGVALAGTQSAQQSKPGGYQHGGAPKDIPNLGLVKTSIKTYYGDTGTGFASADSRYAHDVARVRGKARKALPRLLRRADAQPVVLVDVDDTTLLTYNYEATNDFGYNPVTNDEYIQTQDMDPVFGMPRYLRRATRAGAQVYYLTGRPVTQKSATLDDLGKAGYPNADAEHLYTRDKTSPPSYLRYCDKPATQTFCTTEQYKSSTRRHIEHIEGGQDIVQSFGDQFSDLRGGYADARYKMPNPMYFLP